MFETYLEYYESLEDREAGDEAGMRMADTNANLGFSISKKPSAPNQSLTRIQLKHHCPSFSHHLIVYPNQFLNHSQTIPRSQLQYI